jgi:hexokinase
MSGTNTSLRDEDSEDIGTFLQPLKVDEAVLYHLAHSFSTVYKQLSQTQDDSLFCPTPVTYLPTGLESGRYLAVDVGTTTLRIAFIELLGDSAEDDLPPEGKNDRTNTVIRKAQLPRVRRTLEKAWRIEEHLQQDQAHELFLWIGNCIAEVVKDDLAAGLGGRNSPNYIETGITFSLPIKYVR